jgi:uncharacterized protein (DUF1499 family)
MNIARAGRQAGPGSWLAVSALAVGLACAICALGAGPAYRMHVLSLGAGLQTIRWAAIVAAVGAAIAVWGVVAALRAPARRGLALALCALVVNALVVTPPALLYERAQRLPHIHDISTDTADPPKFVAVLPLRAAARNSVDDSPQTALEQKRGYPDIAPLRLAASPADAFERAATAVRSMGWDLVAVAPGELRIEATDTSRLFGFKDDVVVRVRPSGTGSVVDVRSLSRVGGSDFGVNAKRVRALLRKIGEQAPT